MRWRERSGTPFRRLLRGGTKLRPTKDDKSWEGVFQAEGAEWPKALEV